MRTESLRRVNKRSHPNVAAGVMGYYAEASQQFRNELARAVPRDEIKRLHQKRPWLHFAVTAALVLTLAASTIAIISLDVWYLWLPFAALSGLAIFNFTVLLHEVVHRAVIRESSPWFYRLVGILYAAPSGISATQFIRWHLDHHDGLGSDSEDPKRHYLSPKINARWLKLLYFTPALFAIYFRAARREQESYPAELRRRIAIERNLTILGHLALLALVGTLAGWGIALKAYVIPYFGFFPVAFALNRVGQHYDIDPSDPAKWSTLVRGSLFWDAAFLWSNYHLEHHYFPSVPFYNLAKLQLALRPFYESRGMVAHGYGDLVWHYIVLNRAPHTNWDSPGAGEPASARA
ncbi:MAG: fatty acid desaturase [Acidobacteria bacterium]|nr:fatty acid desaturase [Acidobacteriota bacterium]